MTAKEKAMELVDLFYQLFPTEGPTNEHNTDNDHGWDLRGNYSELLFFSLFSLTFFTNRSLCKLLDCKKP